MKHNVAAQAEQIRGLHKRAYEARDAAGEKFEEQVGKRGYLGAIEWRASGIAHSEGMVDVARRLYVGPDDGKVVVAAEALCSEFVRRLDYHGVTSNASTNGYDNLLSMDREAGERAAVQRLMMITEFVTLSASS